MKVELKLSKAQVRLLMNLIGSRINFLESDKFKTRDDEMRMAQLHECNVIWGDLAVLYGRLDD